MGGEEEEKGGSHLSVGRLVSTHPSAIFLWESCPSGLCAVSNLPDTRVMLVAREVPVAHFVRVQARKVNGK